MTVEKYYTNFTKIGNYIMLRGIEDGLRVKKKFAFKPTMFVQPPKGITETEWHDIKGESVVPKVFDDMSSAWKFIDEHKHIPDFKVLGMEKFPVQFVHDYYKEELDYTQMDASMFNIGYYDIETRPSSEGYSSPKDALGVISAICILDNHGHHFTFGLNEFIPNERCPTTYVRFKDERHMLMEFLKCWKTLDLDIISGWNSTRYDDVYVYYRLKRLFGEEIAKTLSPYNRVREYSVNNDFGGSDHYVTFEGMEQIDYMDLTIKFGLKYGTQENNKLDTWAETILGRKKVDYEEYGSLVKFEQQNPQLFMEYNVTDTNLVKEINDKTQYMELMLLMAYEAKTNYSDVLGTIAWWDSYGYGLLNSRKVAVPLATKALKEKYPGGYVKPPIKGRHSWATTYDFTSLYPSCMMMWNTSPETIGDWIDVNFDDMVRGNYPKPTEGYCVAANGWQFKTDKIGFIPELVGIMFNGRVVLKKELKKQENIYEKMKLDHVSASELAELNVLIRQLDMKQNSKKLSANSFYGAVGNNFYRFYDIRIASAITLSGQLAIQTSDVTLNNWLESVCGTKKDRVAYCDTDSASVVYDDLLNKINPNASTESKIKMMISLSQDRIEPLLNKTFTNMGNALGCTLMKLFMKTEGICESAVYIKKKMYIQKVLWSEGVQYAEPKYKIMGLAAVRSGTPKAVQKFLKDSYKICMDETEEGMQVFIKDKRKVFGGLSVEEIAAPKTANGLEKYANKYTIYEKGCPSQVRGSLLYNYMLDNLNLKSDLELIKSGDKPKYVYLKVPNTIFEDCICFPEKLPKQFGLHKYVDYDTMWEKLYLKPINAVLDVIGWKAEYVETVDSLFGD